MDEAVRDRKCDHYFDISESPYNAVTNSPPRDDGGVSFDRTLASVKLPNGANAYVDLRKLTAYALDPDHERGREKARLFKAMLDLEPRDAPTLRQALLNAARCGDAMERGGNRYGTRYMIEFEMEWKGRRARVRSIWFVRVEEDFPRLVSCFPLTEDKR